MADQVNTNPPPNSAPTRPSCPGWPHPYDFNNPHGQDLCELDRKAYRWLSSRKETTHQELEAYRQRQHAVAGLISAPEEF